MEENKVKALQVKRLKSISEWLLAIFVLIIIGVTIFTRFWNISGGLEFLGDQGRDAVLVRRIYTDLDPVFIGPVTSVGNMYLGPLYYYFMVPFLMLSSPSPVGPAYAVALLSLLSVGLIAYIGKKMFSLPVGLVATGYLAFNAIYIQYSRFSWNPNPAPIASLLMLYWTYLAWTKNFKYWILVALAFGVLIQLHYITLLAGVSSGSIFLLQLLQIYSKNWLKKKTTSPSKFIGAMAFLSNPTYTPTFKQLFSVVPIGIVLILAMLSPLFIFDLKHDGLNRKAFQNLLFKEDAFKNSNAPVFTNITRSLLETQGRSLHFITEISFGEQRRINIVLASLFVLTLISLLATKQKEKEWPGIMLLFSYIGIGILGTSFYRGSLFNHYILYVFPMIALGWGAVFSSWIRWKKIMCIPVLFIIYFFLQYNIPGWFLKTAGWSIYDLERTSEQISKDLDSQVPFTIVLLTGTGDLHGMNYRYFLTTKGLKALDFAQIDQVQRLVIINEDQPNFDSENTEIHEIQVFPTKNPTLRYTIENGPEILIMDRI